MTYKPGNQTLKETYKIIIDCRVATYNDYALDCLKNGNEGFKNVLDSKMIQDVMMCFQSRLSCPHKFNQRQNGFGGK